MDKPLRRSFRCFTETSVINQSWVLRINIYSENCYLRQARIRYASFSKIMKLIIFILTFAGLVGCDSGQENEFSNKFYKEYRLSFLQSDLRKYVYNPRLGFTKHSLRVLIFQDSAIRVIGLKQFNNEFCLSVDTLFGNDVVIKTQSNGDLELYSADEDIETKQVIVKSNIKVNPVTYFQNLRQQITTYHIIAIERHPSVNTIGLIFSNHDYLIYKPDSLVFKTNNT